MWSVGGHFSWWMCHSRKNNGEELWQWWEQKNRRQEKKERKITKKNMNGKEIKKKNNKKNKNKTKTVKQNHFIYISSCFGWPHHIIISMSISQISYSSSSSSCIETTQISLGLSCYKSLSFITFGMPFKRHLFSTQSWWMLVFAGRLALMYTCVSIPKRTWLMNSFLLPH